MQSLKADEAATGIRTRQKVTSILCCPWIQEKQILPIWKLKEVISDLGTMGNSMTVS
jgi:hypothetical protein